MKVRCTGDNLVQNMPTYQSSTEGDKVASQATDYNFTTQSCTGAAHEHPWWAVDLGAKYDVRHVNITASTTAGTHRRTCRIYSFITYLCACNVGSLYRSLKSKPHTLVRDQSLRPKAWSEIEIIYKK